ncbi:MAG: hypothetical protein WAM14_08855 [Candidatus Nitrosopolaris sp.]
MISNKQTTIAFSSAAIAAVIVLFASGPIVATQQAFACGWGGGGCCGGCGGGWGGYPYYGGFGFGGFHHGFGGFGHGFR